VAGRTDGSVLLAGSIDEAAIYSKALGADEIAWIFNAGWGNDLNSVLAPSNLVTWWRMGEHTAGGVVPDWATGGSYDLTLVGSPTVQDDAPAGAGYETQYVDESWFDYYTSTPRTTYTTDFVDTDLAAAMSTFSSTPVSGPPTFYKMRARDGGVPAPGYVTWVVMDEPDFGGAGYPDGEPTPSSPSSMIPGSAVVVSTWQE